MSKPATISKSAAARRIGVRRETVDALIRRGTLQVDHRGKVLLDALDALYAPDPARTERP